MTDTNSASAEKPVRQRYGSFNMPGRYIAHVALAPEDQKLARETIDAIANLTGQRPSLSVILRAGIAAIAEDVKTVKVERQKKPDEHGKAETNLLWAIARSARLVTGGTK
jgi:hypothetical protein